MLDTEWFGVTSPIKMYDNSAEGIHNYMKKVLSVRNNRIFLYGILLYMVICVFIYWDHYLDIMNTTVFAFSYQYGFMPRGILGTFLWLYDSIVPFDAISHSTIYLISEVATAIYFIIILWFVITILATVGKKQQNISKWILVVLVLISVPMFLSEDNFGRLDVYLMILMIFCLILLVNEKLEFLIVPAVTLAALIHEGFVFMNLNIILVILLYKCIIKTDKKERLKYIILLALTFIIPSIIFLYCEFFSHNLGMDVFNDCFAVATKVSHNNDPHEEVLLHEIIGFDVNDMELKHRIWNFEDTPIFLVLFSPYIVFMIAVFRKYVKTAVSKVDKFISFIVLVGPLTLLPEIILKVDYGRYVFSILFYYLAIFLVLLGLRDKRVEETAQCWKETILRHKEIGIVGVVTLFMFIPFKGYRICDVVTMISDTLFK